MGVKWLASSTNSVISQPCDCENLLVIQADFLNYKVRKVYILSPILGGLYEKLPMRRALNLLKVFSSVTSDSWICEHGLVPSTFPRMEEKEKWVFQVRPKALGVWSLPINSPRWEGHLIHQISVTFIFSNSVKHLSPFSLPGAEGHHTLTNHSKWNEIFPVFICFPKNLEKKKALTHCGFTGKLFGSHLALPSLIVSLICSSIRLISMFLTYYSQIHSSGWCDRFTNSFIKEMLQVYLVVFLLFQPISSY